MNTNGTIIIIEDDMDDQFVIEKAFDELKVTNERKYFPDGISALTYLKTTPDRPFLILSDIDLPVLNGLELRDKLFNDAELNSKCIPYIFFTTFLNHQIVIDAYSKSSQGFFVKPDDFKEIKDTIGTIINYWKRCAAPNNF